MFESTRNQGPAWTSVFIATAGVVYTVLNALGKAEELCFTSGCTLFKDITLFGHSLWWFGTGFFLLVLPLALLGKRRTALTLTALALIADMVLLVFMAFTSPCFPCIITASLFALLFLSLNSGLPSRRRKGYALLLVWFFTLCPNLFATVDSAMGTWAIAGPDNADMQIFFSPSCPVCRQTVERFAADPDARIAFYPVSENDTDILRIRTMQSAMTEGTSFYIAFTRSLRDDMPPPADIPLSLRWDLFRNKARLGSLGVSRIPVLITNGMPTSLLTQPTPHGVPAAPEAPVFSGSDTSGMPNFTDFAGCGQNASEPCNE